MITVLTLAIFTVAFVVAAEYAVWRPERRLQAALNHRLSGLRTQAARPARSLLKQQQMSGVSFLHEIYSRLEVVKQLQVVIDQAALHYRAGSVISLSGLVLGMAFLLADLLDLFPFTILSVMFAIASVRSAASAGAKPSPRRATYQRCRRPPHRSAATKTIMAPA